MPEEVKEAKVKADNKKQALEKAYQQFEAEVEDEVDKSDIYLEFVEKDKGVLGLFGGGEVYKAFLELGKVGEDGDFEFEVRDDGIFLTVHQPEGDGDEVKLYQIEEVIEEKGIVEVDYEAVSDALTRDGEEVKIAERKPELDRDAQIELEISKDGMQAYLDYTPPMGGDEYTAEKVLEEVREEGVVYGLNEEELKEVFDPEEELRDFVIAEGKEVTPGKDGEIELKFDLERQDRKVNIQEDGQADFYNLGRIINVEEGDILAEKAPPEEGEPGKKVTGEEIEPEPVVEATFPTGDNVKLSEDMQELIAETDGQVVYTDKISVREIHQVNGNVNLSTGNIDFNGSVIVKGDVEEGMEIKAEGNVTIEGSAYKAHIEADGQVIVTKGLIGGKQGKIKAEGDVEVKFIENGMVETKGSLRVQDAIMHSNIDAQKRVEVEHGKGLIVGGEVRAGQEVEAVTIGSNLATPTEIAVGITPKLRDDFNQASSELESKQEQLDEAIKNINQLKKLESKGQLESRRENLLNQLIKQRYTLSREIEDLKKKKNELAKTLEKSENARVKVRGTIYSGVTITIGSCTERIGEENQFVTYYEEEGKIKYSSYN